MHGEDHVSQVTLKDGRDLPCDLFLIAAGIQPNVDLAQAAGLKVNRGIVVDDAMRTSALDIFAAGDACEFAGQVPGLWAVAVEQAKVAAINAVGGQAIYNEIVPVTMLKVAGIDLISMGRIDARSDAEVEIAQQDPEGHGYRKLVIADGKLVGAILLGDSQNMTAVTAAVKEGRDVSQYLDALYAGQWDVLGDTALQASTNDQSKWKPVPASEPRSMSKPIPAPKAASKTKPRTIQSPNSRLAWTCQPAGWQCLEFAPVPQMEVAQSQAKGPAPHPVKAHEHADEPVMPHERQQSAAFTQSHQTRFRTIIFDFKRERSEIDASR